MIYGADLIKPDLEKTKHDLEILKGKQNEVTKVVETKYIEKKVIVKEKGDEIIKYINTNNDNDCNLHKSFVMLHDSAAKNTLPDPTGSADETPSGVKLSTAEKVIAENYELFHEVSLQLKSLQEWVSEQLKLNK